MGKKGKFPSSLSSLSIAILVFKIYVLSMLRKEVQFVSQHFCICMRLIFYIIFHSDHDEQQSEDTTSICGTRNSSNEFKNQPVPSLKYHKHQIFLLLTHFIDQEASPHAQQCKNLVISAKRASLLACHLLLIILPRELLLDSLESSKPCFSDLSLVLLQPGSPLSLYWNKCFSRQPKIGQLSSSHSKVTW